MRHLSLLDFGSGTHTHHSIVVMPALNMIIFGRGCLNEVKVLTLHSLPALQYITFNDTSLRYASLTISRGCVGGG